MTTRRALLWAALTIAATTLIACDEDEVAGTGGHGTPVDAQLFAGTVELTPDVELPEGQTVRVEVRFLDDHGHVIEGLEEGHYTKVVFDPTTLATATQVPDQRFFIDVDVLASDGTTGTVSVGYGHSEAADEDTFPFAVTIVP